MKKAPVALVTRRSGLRSGFAALIALGFMAACGQAGTSGATPVAPAMGEMSLGVADAPVTIIEYASVTCGACKSFHEQVLPDIKSKYVANGQVRIVFREFPTPPVPLAMAGFAAARCAGKDKYFDVLDTLFTNQQQWFEAARAGQADAKLAELVAPHGLTKSQVEACVKNEELIRAISEIVKGGEDVGVNSTPTLFINGERYAFTSIEALNAHIDGLLAAAS